MKKSTFYVFGVTLAVSLLVSCGSSKKGCGLTSDAQKIEQTSEMTQTIVVAED